VFHRIIQVNLNWWPVATGHCRLSGLSKSRPNPPHRRNQIAPHEFSLKPQHPVAQPQKHPVPARISRDTLRMVTSVYFHNETSGGRCKVNHEPINNHLTPKRNTKPFAGKTPPQHLLRIRTIVPHKLSATCKQRPELELLT